MAFIGNPTTGSDRFNAAQTAKHLHEYCKEELDQGPTFWRAGGRRPFCTVNKEFLSHLVVVRKERADVVGPPRMRGTTVLVSPVLRVGRTTEESQVKARIVLPGIGERDVDVDDGAYGPLCEAVKSREVVNLRARVDWRRSGDDLALDPQAVVIASVEERKAVTNGAKLVALLGGKPPLTAEDVRRMRAEDGDE